MRTTLDGLKKEEIRASKGIGARRSSVVIAAVLGITVMAAAIVLWRAWPFTQANVTKELEQTTSSTVRIGEFHRTFFPHPGCVAQGVTFERGKDPQNRAVMTVERLTIEGSLTGLFTKHLALIQADGAHAVFSPLANEPGWKPTPSDIVVDELRASAAILEFTRQDSKKPPVKFAVHELVVHHLAVRDPMKFQLRIKNPEPPGEVSANGTFGPWNMDQVSATPISGGYSFRDADLAVFGGIGGILASDGKFEGTLESIEVKGTTTTPDFSVRGSSHKIGLKSEFHVEVDATNGDVTLDEVRARMVGTTVVSRGSIAGRENENGKTAALDLGVHSGRIQDLLLMFVSEGHAPLNGVVSLKAKAVIPPGPKRFLQKLEMTGDFGIESALFTNENTQESVEKLSTVARGDPVHAEDPQNVVSDLQGHVVVRNGIATFSQLSFRVPGALARLQGTFDLTTQQVNLRGMLLMDAKLPQATSGVKSFLLKAIDPFLKKNRRGGAKIPVSITGTYHRPIYKSDPV